MQALPKEGLLDAWRATVLDFGLAGEFADLERDIGCVLEAVDAELGEFRPRADFQTQVLSSLFYRSKAGYSFGKIINGLKETPFALPILYDETGRYTIDTVREVSMKHHADLLDPPFWQSHKDRILAGHVHDVFPYDPSRRFRQCHPGDRKPPLTGDS